MDQFSTNKEYIDCLKKEGIEYAIFDVDGTISKTNTIKLFLFVKKCSIKNPLIYRLWLLSFIISLPYYYVVDSLNRDNFQRVFMKKFSKFQFDDLNSWCEKYFKEKVVELLIPETVALMELMKKEFQVNICSLSISLLIDQYSKYFQVPADASIRIIKNEESKKCFVDLSRISNYKYEYVSKYPGDKLVVIADSKHDIPIFQYAYQNVVVAKKMKNWMKVIKNKVLLNCSKKI